MRGGTRKRRNQHYRCSNCGVPIPVGYVICGMCGKNQSEPLPVRVNTMEELTREYNNLTHERS